VSRNDVTFYFKNKTWLFEEVGWHEAELMTDPIRRISRSVRGIDPAAPVMGRRFRVFLDKRPEWPLLLLELLVERVRRTQPIEAQLNPDSLEADRLISAHRLLREELATAIDRAVNRLDLPTDYAGAWIATPLSWALFGLALERTLNPDEMTDADFEGLVAGTVEALMTMR
jgi:AcrR family transcriptional regulator